MLRAVYDECALMLRAIYMDAGFCLVEVQLLLLYHIRFTVYVAYLRSANNNDECSLPVRSAQRESLHIQPVSVAKRITESVLQGL
jgi:hypothetical protein